MSIKKQFPLYAGVLVVALVSFFFLSFLTGKALGKVVTGKGRQLLA
jgi:hypothetical protein